MATISAGNSALVGNLIAEALDAVGADGVLSIETGNSLETTVEVQEGMLIDRGYISPQFVTNQVDLAMAGPLSVLYLLTAMGEQEKLKIMCLTCLVFALLPCLSENRLDDHSCSQEKQLVEFDNARILVADQKIETVKEIIPVLEKISQLNAPLLLITEDITGASCFPLLVVLCSLV